MIVKSATRKEKSTARHEACDGNDTTGPYWTPRAFLVFVVFAGIAIALLWTEHRAHTLGVLPLLFILACSPLHTFLHGRHGRAGSQSRDSNGPAQ
ncbi:MAG: DUF2933 domain-containing protein [Pseudomonadota bacterium]